MTYLYFYTCLLLFWVPGTALTIALWKKLKPESRQALGTTCALFAIVTFALEYVYLNDDIWSFYEAHFQLLGIEIFGAPVEEFVFWFGATPFVLTWYLTLAGWHQTLGSRGSRPARRANRSRGRGNAWRRLKKRIIAAVAARRLARLLSHGYRTFSRPVFKIIRGIPRYVRGVRYLSWAVRAIDFIILTYFLFRKVRAYVRWKACWSVVLLFETAMMIVEHNAIHLGLWVYNEQSIWGVRIWNVPIEEPLIYYLFPPILAIMMYEYIHGVFRKTIKPPEGKTVLFFISAGIIFYWL